MGIQEIAPKIQTSDGKEWAEEQREEAETHQRQLDVAKAFKKARGDYVREMAMALVTKDGHRFDFSWWRVYYVRVCLFSKPRIEEIRMTSDYPGAYDLGPDQYGATFGESAVFNIRDSTCEYGRTIKITDVYRNKEAAERACWEAQLKWLAEEKAQIDEWAAKAGFLVENGKRTTKE